MTKTDKIERAIRFAFGVGLFVSAAVITLIVSDAYHIDQSIALGIMTFGCLIGRIARGIER